MKQPSLLLSILGSVAASVSITTTLSTINTDNVAARSGTDSCTLTLASSSEVTSSISSETAISSTTSTPPQVISSRDIDTANVATCSGTTSCTPPLASSSELSSFGSGESSLTFGPPVTSTSVNTGSWSIEVISAATVPAGTDTVVALTIVTTNVTVTGTMPTTTTAPAITIAPLATTEAPSTTAASSPSAPTATSDYASVAYCFAQTGGLQANNEVSPGCASMFQRVMSCYVDTAPWTTPYNSPQNTDFQQCLCETGNGVPFNTDSVLYRNFSGCSDCLINLASKNGSTMGTELQRIENFCSSPYPIAYLFVIRLLGWLNGLHPHVVLPNPPMHGDICAMQRNLQAKFTTMFELDNVAYGAAMTPFGGSLRGVTPSLTTSTGVVSGNSITATLLVTWLPTGGSSVDLVSASNAAADTAASALASAATVAAQGGPSQNCHGKGACSHSEASTVRGQLLWLGAITLTLSILLVQ